MSNVQPAVLHWKFWTKWKNVVFFVEILFAVHPSSPEKKNYDEKMMVFWTFSRSFQSCSNSPIALLFSVGIVVYILVMIYYCPVSCLMIWSDFYIKQNLKDHWEIEKKEKIQNSNYDIFATTKQEGPDICFDISKLVDLF